MNIAVGCYGLHWDQEVAWLVQGRGGNNFVGLRAQCPFTGPRAMCTHLVPVAAPIPDKFHWEQFLTIMEDPLVKAMYPVPKEAGNNLYFIEDAKDELGLYLANLTRLSSPIGSVVKPAWTMQPKQLERMVNSSNIQPLVINQTKARQQPVVDTVRKLGNYTPRTVVVAGDSEVIAANPFNVITSKIKDLISLDDLIALPLESIGAFLIRRFARHEALDAPMETRQERRARMFNPEA